MTDTQYIVYMHTLHIRGYIYTVLGTTYLSTYTLQIVIQDTQALCATYARNRCLPPICVHNQLNDQVTGSRHYWVALVKKTHDLGRLVMVDYPPPDNLPRTPVTCQRP